MYKSKFLLLPFDCMAITESGKWGLGLIVGEVIYIHLLWWFIEIKRYPKTDNDHQRLRKILDKEDDND